MKVPASIGGITATVPTAVVVVDNALCAVMRAVVPGQGFGLSAVYSIA